MKTYTYIYMGDKIEVTAQNGFEAWELAFKKLRAMHRVGQSSFRPAALRSVAVS